MNPEQPPQHPKGKQNGEPEKKLDPSDKRIFGYFDGNKVTYCDPLEIYIRFFKALGGDPDPILENARYPEHPEKELPLERLKRLDATEQLVQAARVCFDFPPLDKDTGEGIPSEACLGALYAWLDWWEKKSARPDSTPTSRESTGPKS
jgi:hypothetical protein